VKVGRTLPQIGEHAIKENIINLSKNAEKQGFGRDNKYIKRVGLVCKLDNKKGRV
jgi:hypothetical protein